MLKIPNAIAFKAFAVAFRGAESSAQRSESCGAGATSVFFLRKVILDGERDDGPGVITAMMARLCRTTTF